MEPFVSRLLADGGTTTNTTDFSNGHPRDDQPQDDQSEDDQVADDQDNK